MFCPLTLRLPAFQRTLPPFPKSREPIDELTSVRLSEAIFPVYLFILWYDLISPLRCPCLVWRTDTPLFIFGGYAVCGGDVLHFSVPFFFLSFPDSLFCCGSPEWGPAISVSRKTLLTRPLSSRARGCVWLAVRLCVARSAAPDCHSPAFLLFLSALCFCLALLTRHPKHVERQGSISAFKHSFWCPCCHFPFEENLKIIFFPKFKGKNQTFFSPL